MIGSSTISSEDQSKKRSIYRNEFELQKPSVALAVFVKTPGLSPLKTRLASQFGQLTAERIYSLCISIIEEKMLDLQAQASFVKVYWAVAETAAADYWSNKSFKVIFQGEGGLGSRLNHVYSQLLVEHKAVAIVGSDSPQIRTKSYIEACEKLRDQSPEEFLIGPSVDGGFYFFGGSSRIEKKVWEETTYSRENTLLQLTDKLEKLNLQERSNIQRLEPEIDLDEPQDIVALKRIMEFSSSRLSDLEKDLLALINSL